LPEQARRYRAPRTPGLGHDAQLPAVRALRQRLQPLHRDLQRQVARGPNIRPPQREEQEHLGAPIPEAAQLHDRRERGVVAKAREARGREAPLQDRAREAAGIADLLSCETAILERRVIELEELARRQWPAALLEAPPELLGDIERELLLQD